MRHWKIAKKNWSRFCADKVEINCGLWFMWSGPLKISVRHSSASSARGRIEQHVSWSAGPTWTVLSGLETGPHDGRDRPRIRCSDLRDGNVRHWPISLLSCLVMDILSRSRFHFLEGSLVTELIKALILSLVLLSLPLIKTSATHTSNPHTN